MRQNRVDSIQKILKSAQEEPEQDERYWYRIGDPEYYSEFTFDPTGAGGPPMMTGGRGSGFASGQYAFGEPGEGRVQVPVPKNPLRVGGGVRPQRAVHDFQDNAISMMRFAEAYDDLGEINRFDRYGYAKSTLGTLIFSMSAYAPREIGKYSEKAEQDVLQAIKDWSKHKQVHPINILLNRWGYDGIEWVGTADWAAKTGDFGNVTFPQIDEEGRIEGLEPVDRKYMRRMAKKKKSDMDWHLTYRQPFFRQNYDYEGDFVERLKKRLKALEKQRKKKKKKAFIERKIERKERLEFIFKESFLKKVFKALRRGNSGPRVRQVQQALVDKGFPLPRFGVDGIFGSETEAAVKDFQRENNLQSDGVVGEQTISKLEPSIALETSMVDPSGTAEEEEIPLVPFDLKKYEPFSRRAKRLFRRAARAAGLPEEWAASEGLHSILKRESGGWVGIPNYTYGVRAADPKYWGQIHEEIRNGITPTSSGATGLGQLLPRNVDRFYPSGRKGIGDPLEEAIGMLRYIKERYGSPDSAWSVYGGKAVKTDPETGAQFTEGY